MADLVAFLTAYRYYLTEVGQSGNPAAGRAVFDAKGCPRATPRAARRRSTSRGRAWTATSGQYLGDLARAGDVEPRPGDGERDARPRRAVAEVRRHGDGRSARVPAGRQRRRQPASACTSSRAARGAGAICSPSKRCIACHAIAGRRRPGRAGPRHAARTSWSGRCRRLPALMWNHSQAMTAEFARRGVPRVTFSGQEMADIIAYLYFVNYANVRATPERGGALFVDKCSPCHTHRRRQAGRSRSADGARPRRSDRDHVGDVESRVGHGAGTAQARAPVAAPRAGRRRRSHGVPAHAAWRRPRAEGRRGSARKGQ